MFFECVRWYANEIMVLPLNPGAQVQLKSATWSMQVPPLWQGFDQQSFQSVSQCSPVYPSSQ